jgi:hypothetical protein
MSEAPRIVGRSGSSPVRLTILYRHPQRLDEAGMTVVADQTNAAAMTNQLVKRGFLVVEIKQATFAKTPSTALPPFPPSGCAD